MVEGQARPIRSVVRAFPQPPADLVRAKPERSQDGSATASPPRGKGPVVNLPSLQGGGGGGCTTLAAGVPEDIVRVERSFTGKYLAPLLKG